MDTLTIFTLFLATFGCVFSIPIDSEDEKKYERTPLGDSIDKASLKFLKEAYKAGDDKNLITSPLGIMILLSMYSSGAGPVSKEEISRMLGGSDIKQISESYSELSSEFAKMNPDYLTLANRIYVQKGLQLKDDFSKAVRTYDSEVLNIDFKDMEEAAKIINKWSNETTKGNIPEPVKPDTLDADTILGLFNIIYFKGHWASPFEVDATKDEDFHVDSKTVVEKPTMNLRKPLHYTEAKEIGARIIELPYNETGFRMVVVLPDEVDGLSSVIEKAADKGLLEHVFKLQPSGLDVELHLPKFEVKSRLDLKELLPKIGINGIFNEPTYDIVHGADPVAVTKGFQEAVVKVDEEGATAAAFTGFGVSITSVGARPPPPIPFIVDRPFLYYILHQDKVLFAGTYTH